MTDRAQALNVKATLGDCVNTRTLQADVIRARIPIVAVGVCISTVRYVRDDYAIAVGGTFVYGAGITVIAWQPRG